MQIRAMTGWIAMLGLLLMVGGCSGKTHRPFDGETLNGWAFKGDAGKSKWMVGEAEMSEVNAKLLDVEPGEGQLINNATKHGDSVDIYTIEKYGDSRIQLELMVPQKSNSGIYVMGEYEVQVLDSWGVKEMKPSDIGAIYGAAVPKVNASKEPGEWQKFDIVFKAPRFDRQGNKTQNAKFISVKLNGKLLHEDLEMPGPTPAGVKGKEAPTGPLMFQGDHGPVAYRKIKITTLSLDEK